MNYTVVILTVAVSAASLIAPSDAQEGLSTSGTIGGHNTIQQAPSGGRVGPATGVTASGAGNGQPTAAEKAEEKRNSELSTICKGC